MEGDDPRKSRTKNMFKYLRKSYYQTVVIETCCGEDIFIGPKVPFSDNF